MTSQSWPAGVPCWTDLMTPDPSAVEPFYSAVLGWKFTEPDEQFGGYVMAMKDGAPAAGVGPMQEGARSAWTLYFASEDADATAARVSGADGAIFAEPMDVGSLGRMFVATDPTGAVFGVWQAKDFAGAAVTNAPGGLVWEDLRSTDPDGARTFYNAVFDLAYDHVEGAPFDYMSFATASDPRPRGGIGSEAPGSDGAESHWLVYFGVEDVAAAITAATGNGGAAPVPSFDTPYGAMAGLTDPAGAAFYVVQMTPTK